MVSEKEAVPFFGREETDYDADGDLYSYTVLCEKMRIL